MKYFDKVTAYIDEESDILYVKLEDGEFSHNVDEKVVLDIGTDGRILGIELSLPELKGYAIPFGATNTILSVEEYTPIKEEMQRRRDKRKNWIFGTRIMEIVDMFVERRMIKEVNEQK